MNQKSLWEKQFALLEKYNLPIPVKAEELKDKKLVSILRVGVFKEPLLIFESNKAIWVQESSAGDSYFVVNVYGEYDDFGCSDRFDIQDYLYKLKNINYLRAKEAFNECIKLIREDNLEQKKEQLKRLKKELGEV